MIEPAYAVAMARYNTWQNANLYGAAAKLSDAQRKEHRGAFFGSIHATLNHLLWADQMWLSRFGAIAPPAAKTIDESISLFSDFDAMRAARAEIDRVIEDWAGTLRPNGIAGDLVFHSASFNQTLTRPRAVAIMHIFNHQTHHRGQVHALLTGFGVMPSLTDMPMNPDIWAGLVR